MVSIALICEGVSESKMLSYIINRYLGEEVVVNSIHPSLKTSHGQEKQDEDGGWLQVLRHCKDDVVKDIMATNDYLVVQIDTDTCGHAGYDVNEYDEGGVKVCDEVLYDRVCERLVKDLAKDVLNRYEGRILYAICINETECWLLPLYYGNGSQKCRATNNCIYHLNQKLQKDGLGIPKKAKNTPEAIKTYQNILKKLKRKDIPRVAQYNYGFKRFVEQMDEIKRVVEENSEWE